MLAVALLAVATASPPHQLDAAGFKRDVVDRGASERWFIFFFSPHCGHCRAMEPAWEELASKPGISKAARLVKVDATEEKALADALDVNGYPTLLLIEPSVASRAVYEYEGDRSADSLHAFAANSHAGLAKGAHRRRGYLGLDGTVRPSLVDVARRVPTDAGEIISFAIGTSPAAALFVAALLMAIGALLALGAALAPPAARRGRRSLTKDGRRRTTLRGRPPGGALRFEQRRAEGAGGKACPRRCRGRLCGGARPGRRLRK